MENDEKQVHTETDAARAGSTPNIVRWILAISLFAAIVLLSAVWITGALTHDDPIPKSSVTSSASEPEAEL